MTTKNDVIDGDDDDDVIDDVISFSVALIWHSIMCMHGLDGIHIILGVGHFQKNKLGNYRGDCRCLTTTF
jgi:hypothetical protein